MRIQFLLPVFTLVCSPVFSQRSLFDSLRLARSATVFFASGKHELPIEPDTAILNFSDFCKRQTGQVQIRITAHTDSIGSSTSNLLLSQKRAETVRNLLISNGLNAENIQPFHFGERKKAASNADETGRQTNRRATLEAFVVRKMTTVSGQIQDDSTGLGIESTVFFKTKEARDSVQTDTTGRFSVRLPEGIVVGVESVAKGYFFESRTFKTLPKTPPVMLRLPLARPGEVVPLKNLYFVGNEYILLPGSVPELDKVQRFMLVNPDFRIEIAGHINKPGTPVPMMEPWEMQLSINRANSVYTWLVRKGISPARMTFKGYGNTQMRFPKARSAEDQEANRRVEIRILGTTKIISEARK